MKFVVKGKPIGKQRPKFARRGNFVTTYTPQKTKDYENTIKNTFLSQIDEKYDKDYSGAVKIKIWAFFEPCKSYSKKKYNELLETPHLKKPDGDNIIKIVCDALNGIAWKDDSQIYDIQIFKYYDEEDKLIVEIDYV